MEAVKHHGVSLECASDELKKDKEVVVEALKQHGFSLNYGMYVYGGASIIIGISSCCGICVCAPRLDIQLSLFSRRRFN